MLINIITRTHNRPNFFKKCLDSIKTQTYSNIHHIITYQVDSDLKYINLNKINNTTLVNVPNLKRDPNLYKHENNREYYHAPYNTFMNKALKNIKEGWVVVLDDDDIFSSSNSLETLYNEIQKFDTNTNHIWRVRSTNIVIPDDFHFDYYSKGIYPDYPLQPCQIAHMGMCYHSSNSKFVNYHPWSLGDYHAYSELEKHIPKRNMINQVLSQNQIGPGSGNTLDLPN